MIRMRRQVVGIFTRSGKESFYRCSNVALALYTIDEVTFSLYDINL